MYDQVEKPKENKSRGVANSVSQKKSSAKQGFEFVDNRPEAIMQRKFKGMLYDSKIHPIQLMKFGKEDRFQETFTTKTGLQGISSKEKSDKSSFQRMNIGDALNGFMNNWDKTKVASNIAGAYDDLSKHLSRVNIKYGDNSGSKQENNNVSGFWIGDTIDLLNQLYKFSYGGKVGFRADKFWRYTKRMRDLMWKGDDD